MTDHTDPPPNPETPWEFLEDDEITVELAPAAEDAAMHIEIPGRRSVTEPEQSEVVVHYLDDEHPEVADVSAVPEKAETTAEVEDLFIRQHYLPPDESPD